MSSMKAVVCEGVGKPGVMKWKETKTPEPGADEIRVDVKATAVNSADTLQRRGKYPVPEGVTEVMGLEMSGVVNAVGQNVSEWKTGDEVFGLLPGGGYAEQTVIHKNMAWKKPATITFEEASAIPEVFLTAYQALFWIGGLQHATSKTVLIHAAASGVGTAAIQLAKKAGATVIGTASAGKHDLCKELGIDLVINYKQDDFLEVINEEFGHGVDVVLDMVGANYFERNLSVLNKDGRLVNISSLSGAKAEINLLRVLAKRLRIEGTTLRSRSRDYQIKLAEECASYCMQDWASGELKPVIDRVMPVQEVSEAHRVMEKNQNAGKIVLKVGNDNADS